MTDYKSIKSKENKFYGLLKSLSTKKYRLQHKKYLVEGLKMCMEASEEGVLESLVVRESSIDLIQEFFADVESTKIVVFADVLFQEVTQMQNSEGVVALVKMDGELQNFYSNRILCLDGIKDPGNMGTIIRSAEAFGFKEIILTNNCVDIYNSRTLRASMGSVFRTRFKTLDFSDIFKLKNDNYKLYTTNISNSLELDSVPIENKLILIIGSESHGVSDDFIQAADYTINIPMCGRVESLNAGVAASITMYHLKS